MIDTARTVPRATILPFFGSGAVRALVSGDAPSTDAWASFTEKLLTSLVAEQGKTSAALAQLDAKLDRVALALYENAMQNGRAARAGSARLAFAGRSRSLAA